MFTVSPICGRVSDTGGKNDAPRSAGETAATERAARRDRAGRQESERFTGASLQRVIIEQSPAIPLTPCRDRGPWPRASGAPTAPLVSFQRRAFRMALLYPCFATPRGKSARISPD